MKFQIILASVLSFSATVLAQSIAIGIPPGPAKVFPGQDINVMVQRPVRIVAFYTLTPH
jgi:hypothetical protein